MPIVSTGASDLLLIPRSTKHGPNPRPLFCPFSYTLSRLSSPFLYVSSVSVFMFSSNTQTSCPFAFVSFCSFVLTRTRLSYCTLIFHSFPDFPFFFSHLFFLFTDFRVLLLYSIFYTNLFISFIVFSYIFFIFASIVFFCFI